jgi:hypothetical protein
MIKINEKFEADYDGKCWLLYEWRNGFKIVDDLRYPELKRTGPSYYSAVEHLCSAVIDRSAGNACHDAGNIIEAVKKARSDLDAALHGGGLK